MLSFPTVGIHMYIYTDNVQINSACITHQLHNAVIKGRQFLISFLYCHVAVKSIFRIINKNDRVLVIVRVFDRVWDSQ